MTPPSQSPKKWYYVRNEIALIFGMAFVLYGMGICVLAYFPMNEQRGSLISTVLPWANIFAALLGFYIALFTTYISPNPRRGTHTARLIAAPLLMLAPLLILVIGFFWNVWPTSDMLLGMTFIAIGVSILRIFVTTATFDDP